MGKLPNALRENFPRHLRQPAHENFRISPIYIVRDDLLLVKSTNSNEIPFHRGMALTADDHNIIEVAGKFSFACPTHLWEPKL